MSLVHTVFFTSILTQLFIYKFMIISIFKYLMLFVIIFFFYFVVFIFCFFFFFSSRRRHTRLTCDWSSDVCSSDLLLVLGVPPHVALALRPGRAVRPCGGAVVEDAPVRRPRPAPVGRDPVLLGVGPPASRLVDPVGVDAGMDPRAAGRRAVVLEVLVRGDERAVGVAAVDLLQHRLGVGLVLRALRGVVPGESPQREVTRLAGVGQPLADAAPEVVGEP